MANDESPQYEPQSGYSFRDAPQRFRDSHPNDTFSTASGVLFEQAMSQTRMAICLADPHSEDMPLVFVNNAFTKLTGYSEEDVVGKNCRFLQGPDTDPAKVKLVRTAIENEEVVVVELLNYRKDGTKFWNALHLGPIYNDQGRLLYYFGSQWDVSDVHAARAEEQHARTVARELSHRFKNIFAVIAGLVTVAGRANGFRKEAEEINDRIRALGRAFETTLDDASSGSVQLGSSIRSVLAPYDTNDGRIIFEGAEFRVDPNIVSTVGLTMHELASNAIKHGSFSRDGGTVHLSWRKNEDLGALELTWIERGGPPVTAPDGSNGTGLEIIDQLLSFISGTLEREWEASGFKARMTLPLDR